MNHHYIIDIQWIIEKTDSSPSDELFLNWVSSTLNHFMETAELTIRIVDKEEIQSLNHQYRDKDKPTNILSFPFESPVELETPLLGDLIVCQSIVEEEAKEQGKSIESHWAHMIIHGCLHLLGYDHIDDQEAEEMEALEIEFMQQLGFANPYES